MADALDSGSSARKGVEVQVLSRAEKRKSAAIFSYRGAFSFLFCASTRTLFLLPAREKVAPSVAEKRKQKEARQKRDDAQQSEKRRNYENFDFVTQRVLAVPQNEKRRADRARHDAEKHQQKRRFRVATAPRFFGIARLLHGKSLP